METASYLVFVASILVSMLFLGASTCNVTDFEYNTYKNSEDCLLKRLSKMAENNEVLDGYNFNKLKEYCKQYDR